MSRLREGTCAVPPWPPLNLQRVWGRRAARELRSDVLEHRVAASLGAVFGVWVLVHTAAAVADRVRGKRGSPQPGESAIEGGERWVLSEPMATSDATQAGDGAQQGGSGESANGPGDVVGLKEIGFGEVKHGLPDKETCLTVLEKMLLIRRFEERAGEMYAKAKIGGFLHLCIGEEATIVGATQALRESDYLMSTYREHGQALARGTSANAVMAELFGRVGGCSKGRGGSMHLFDMERRIRGGDGGSRGHPPPPPGGPLARR